MITASQVRDVLRDAGLECAPECALIKAHNHVYRLTCGSDAFYLKTYTKDWYGGDIAGTGFHVDHEAAAWRILADHGLSVPAVVHADQTLSNPLRRPFLLTRSLAGLPLTDHLKTVDPVEAKAMLRCVGAYLGQMHAIAFPFPGYLSSQGPAAEPSPGEWQHPIWTFQAFRKAALAVWEHDCASVPQSIVDWTLDLFADHEQALANAYRPPHFVHGDCHAHQFFLVRRDEGWHVAGVVDMEVASAGDCGADWVKLMIEMAGSFPASMRWWEPLFEGYGSVPDLPLLKVRLLAAAHINYTCLGDRSWPGTRAQIMAHILAAGNWESLLDVRGIPEQAV
jgi:Ser/Thr protein kinase RdoA (MazF antagonist)